MCENMSDKSELAQELFKQGYNCSQAVFTAYANDYGIDKETALKLSASFGGGMGRMREVCGALSGIFMVAGLETGATDGKDAEGKKANYDLVQEIADKYRKCNGSIYCRDLLGLSKNNGSQGFTQTTPEERTETYYKKRPCVELVGQVCEIFEELKKERQ